MKPLRKSGDYELNIGSSMARSLYNVTDQANDKSHIGTVRMRVSNWFSTETKNRLLDLSSAEFEQECEELLKDEK